MSNSADLSGGALYWDYNEISGYDTSTYDSNSAGYYGNNYACFAQNLVQITEDEYNSGLITRRMISEIEGTTTLTLDDFGSGSAIPDLYVALVDKFGQIVGDDSLSILTLNVNTSLISTSDSIQPIMSGVTSVSASNGMFYLSDIYFIGRPESDYSKL